MDENLTTNETQTAALPPETLEFLEKMRIKEETKEQELKLKQHYEQVKKDYTSDPTKKLIWDAGFGEALTINKDILLNKEKVEENLDFYSRKAQQILEEKQNVKTEHVDQATPNSPSANTGTEFTDKVITSVHDEGFYKKSNIDALQREGQIDENMRLSLGIYGIGK